ncbi:MAG: hypothetical protein CMK44_01290 [Porticoccus sp.]|nr:hypothetical protein [Porticoccus sp.]
MEYTQKATALSLLVGCGYYIYKNTLSEKKQKMIMFNNWPFHDEVLRYICMKYGDEIDSFNYSVEKIFHFNEWRFRRKEKPVELKINMPNECDMTIVYKDTPIRVKFNMVLDDKNVPYKLMSQHDCCMDEEIVTKLELIADSKEILTQFADEAMEWCKNEKKKIKMNSKETMNIYYYKKDYWALLSKSPKRPLSTVYLKENMLDGIVDKTKKFFSDETRNVYLSFGIPYKSVQLIHGPPGTGKTSLIKSIASHLDCDLYILPISKDMLDTNLVDAFSYISDNEDKERIIVIEDIDTLFDGERKEGDDHNGITLQAFLNCLDGFTCVEGTMLFLTANKPEVLDFAMIRSCRIDNKIELDYADKYQTEKMFNNFLHDQKDKFKEFYKEISHKKFTTAMLQEFLFYNREHDNIMELMDEFISIIDKNDPKNFEVVKEENKNFYS